MMLCRDGDYSLVKSKNHKWIGSRKFDGVRCLAVCDEKGVKLVGRNKTDYTIKFPEVVSDLKGFVGVLDGEIVCCDNFQYTQSRVLTDNKLKQKLLVEKYPATYNVFDILKINDKNIKDDELEKRLSILNMYLCDTGSIKIVETSTDLDAMFEKARENKWEGIIIKNPVSKYREGYRSPDWLKVKLKKSKDIVFVKFEENPAGIRVEDVNGIAIQVTGRNSEAVKQELKKKGSVKIEVEFLEEFDSGKLRQPVFKCLK